MFYYALKYTFLLCNNVTSKEIKERVWITYNFTVFMMSVYNEYFIGGGFSR